MTILDEICAYKKDVVAARKTNAPLSEIKQKLKDCPAVRSFTGAIRNKQRQNHPALIAEIKKASPSAGLIREDFAPGPIARAYEAGGAACLSVLTDEKYFKGHDDYLQQSRQACCLPVLRKDFIVDSYQIYESRTLGADCILLIMGALDNVQAKDYFGCAQDLGMDILVEVHDQNDLTKALELSPALVGINNRNLKTMTVDLDTGLNLGKDLPETVLKVAESGIYTPEQLYRFYDSGFDAFLIGESLMRQENLQYAVKTILQRPAPSAT